MIARLIENLGSEADLFRTFLELLQRQQERLVANDAAGLNEISQLLRQKTLESQRLSRERQQLIEQIKTANAVEGDLNVSRLLELVENDQAMRLRELRQLILSLHDDITRVRNSNALLINKARDCVARTMKMLAQIGAPRGHYAAGGVEADRHQAVAVDRRI